ncbi:hypothetical protein WJX79_010533 [Trebouxia sp. C0005]
MLAASYRSSCVGLPGRRSLLRQRPVSVVLVRAAQKDDPAHNRPELLPDQSSWAEHLSSQNSQADRYRPPTYGVQDIQASRGKFLGRLAVLILGAVLLSERITGKGAVQQLEISATGVPFAITAEVITGKGTLTLLNVETGMDSVSELEAIGAFVVMLLLTEDVVKGKNE